MSGAAEQRGSLQHEPQIRADAWAAFVGAQDGAELLQPWLAIQCRGLPGLHAALLLWSDRPDSFAPAAAWPDANRDLSYLGPSAELALRERTAIVNNDAGPRATSGASVIVAYPCQHAGKPYGAVVLDLAPRSEALVQEVLHRVHWGAGWLESLYLRGLERDARQRLEQARVAMDLITLAAEKASLQEALFAIVNAVAEHFGADRVSIGLERRQRIRLMAISHSAWFDRRAEFVDALENVMEEAFDQVATIVVPSRPQRAYQVEVAHADFSRAHGGMGVCSAVLPGRERALGVLTVETRTAEALDENGIRLVEAIATLVGPIVELRQRLQRLVAGRAVDGVVATTQQLVGPGKPLLKLGLIGAALLIAGLAFVEGSFRITAKSSIEGVVQRAAVAPYRAFVATAPVRAGDVVVAGQLLATLDDRDLALERVKWTSEIQQAEQKLRDAMSRGERAAMQILSAQGRQAQAQLLLVEEKLARAKIVAPVAGLVVSGDLSQLLGSPVDQGHVLFEIAPLDAYRVVVQVDERDVSHVSVGQRGHLVLTGFMQEPLAFRSRKARPSPKPRTGATSFASRPSSTSRCKPCARAWRASPRSRSASASCCGSGPED
jgi:multidrug resistance efflux pump